MWRHIIILLFIPLKVYALKVEINKGQLEPTPIAVTDFVTDNPLGQEVTAVVAKDLAACGLFRLINKVAFIQDPVSLQQGPRFADWRLVNAHLLLAGKIEVKGAKARIEFRLYDVLSGAQIESAALTGEAAKWRQIAHMIADAIYKRVTGEEGYFNTYIAFIEGSGGKKGSHRLAIMDWDGYNARFLTNGQSIVLTPRFSPTELEIAYLSYATGRPCVHLYNLRTGQQSLLGSFEGMSFAPRFSPDGASVIMSIEKNGASAIYVKDLSHHQLRQLTPHVSIDTSPCFSPDGKQIVFTSDRDSPKHLHIERIFIMDAQGNNVRRISLGQGKYSQPVWSPRGDLIAFIKQLEGNFYLGVMRPDGSGERLIIQSYLVEAPSWAPNGRVLMVTIQKGPKERPRLYRIDLTGHNLQLVNTPQSASDGAWSKSLS